VAPTGVKTFTLHFTAPDGRRARLTLGRYPRLPLARARTLAVEGQGHANEGADPRARGAAGVAAFAQDYLEKHVRPNLRSAKAVERRIVKNVLPVLGDRPIEELHKRDINRVIDAISGRGKPVEAARVFEDMRALFRWAVQRGDLDHSPMDGMKKPATGKPRTRVLSDGSSAPEAL
jgi:hypothetical protein